jgi:hypothetical protein
MLLYDGDGFGCLLISELVAYDYKSLFVAIQESVT